MKNIKLIWTAIVMVLIAFVLPLNGQGQVQNMEKEGDAAEVLRKAVEQYWQLENYSMELVSYAYIAAQNDKKVKLSEGRTIRRGHQLLTQSETNDLLIVGEEMLLLDHEDKTMVLGKWHGDLTNKSLRPGPFLDSLESTGGRIILKSEKNGLKTYRLEAPTGLVKAMEIVLDARNVYQKVTCYFRPTEDLVSVYSKTEVLYKNVELDPPSETHFDFEHYLTKAKKSENRKPTPTYETYTFEVLDYSEMYGSTE